MLVVRLVRRPDDSGRGCVDGDVERAERSDLVCDPLGGDVPAQEHRLGSEPLSFRRPSLPRHCPPHVADRHLARAERRETEGDRLADAARTSGHQDRSDPSKVIRAWQRIRGRRRGRNRVPADPAAGLRRPFGAATTQPESVQELDLLLPVTADLVVRREVRDQLSHAGA